MSRPIEKSKMNEALDILLEGDVDLSNALGKGGLIKQLSKATLERALSVEMEEHLGYSRYNRSDGENARNGSYNKNIITEHGVTALDIPRDREGSFEPVIVARKKNRSEGLDQKMLSLYAKGMSLSDIKRQVHELYEADISESLISKITDGVLDEVRTW